jgi:25S rRNA (adenine2142-N1)-methyltransferase
VQESDKRGEMLVRAVKCLGENGILYITLPRSCIDNSRYTNNQEFLEICQALGLEKVDSYFSRKLVFFALEKRRDIDEEKIAQFTKKKIVNQGDKRNNFSLTFKTNLIQEINLKHENWDSS